MVRVPDREGPLLKDIPIYEYEVSRPNRLGQHAFMARLADDSTAAYSMDVEGKLSLILKSGTDTEPEQGFRG